MAGFADSDCYICASVSFGFTVDGSFDYSNKSDSNYPNFRTQLYSQLSACTSQPPDRGKG